MSNIKVTKLAFLTTPTIFEVNPFITLTRYIRDTYKIDPVSEFINYAHDGNKLTATFSGYIVPKIKSFKLCEPNYKQPNRVVEYYQIDINTI